MKNRLKRTIAFVLIVCMLSALLPEMRSVEADGPDSYTLANGNIEVTVSAKNGGFIVRTKDGDKFNKDDNNKRLLFHNGEYDTSFTSFQVTEGTETKEYIFGGNYSFLGLGENDIQVREENGGIVSTWSVDDLTFNQIIQPVWNEGANEHGTIAIYYTVENGKDTPVSVKARLLLDTALEKQDYAYYEMEKAEGGYNRIENETVIQGDDIPANFFAYDNYNNPTITAFTISDTSTDGTAPYKAAFGHWNNLGATVFDFVPDPDMTFTSSYNKRYLTADSAYALYYDLGMVPGSRAQAASFLTYYGIYSNVAVAEKDSFSVNITAPSDLELNTTKDM
ncbi:MAG TPA: hypothetical protein VN580_06865, partial [Clostridia bacterium]|nr:hypothetical protein [Clostridia bacterium]